MSRAQLAALKMPTLVIGNPEDHIHPLCLARDLAAIIPGARLREIPAKTHAKEPYEAAFRVALRSFLQEIHS